MELIHGGRFCLKHLQLPFLAHLPWILYSHCYCVAYFETWSCSGTTGVFGNNLSIMQTSCLLMPYVICLKHKVHPTTTSCVRTQRAHLKYPWAPSFVNNGVCYVPHPCTPGGTTSHLITSKSPMTMYNNSQGYTLLTSTYMQQYCMQMHQGTPLIWIHSYYPTEIITK